MSRQSKTEILDANEQLLVRLAWACEVQGMTQGQAAKQFGVTRLRVNKSLAEARERGIVRVTINSSFGPCIELEDQLRHRYGLETATVAPVGGEDFKLYTVLGAALGQFLNRLLERPDIKLFGMSWGNTLNMATRFMEPMNRPDLEITSVMGGLTKGSDVNSYEITTRLADLCNASHSYFTAPVYAASLASREILEQQQEFKGSIEKIRCADGLALAAGDMQHSLLLADGLPEDIDVNELIEAGAVGDIIGYFLRADGSLIDHDINARVLGIKLADLNDLANVILAAGGMNKVPIIQAILLRNCVNHLVTDEHTARGLLAAPT
ncbi:Erythritol catabolism regulatory protein EryD [Roseobacter fucihabitans]|uniref:Erythritol catabolism regulatory protein EryD n=1 Tax=Roseobacter fucihabitans TaxID=1537242 RepID=A0ABZ2BUM4_9RHOB|nr:sugar-binding domain-containing protein [Roseobacter litoralis]MBC6966090.1 Transcriptional regulator LsrR [Roseobacter litoralis]